MYLHFNWSDIRESINCKLKLDKMFMNLQKAWYVHLYTYSLWKMFCIQRKKRKTVSMRTGSYLCMSLSGREVEEYNRKDGLINYIDTKAKCRHLKNWPVKGLCGRCLSEFIDRRYSQSCWYLRPSFVNCCCPSPLNHPFPLPCVNR